jgi:hypothetical protein
MDPNACLKEMLELARKGIYLADAKEDGSLDPTDAERLCELVLALDGWVTKGGFMPQRWNRPIMLTCGSCRAEVSEIKCDKCGAYLYSPSASITESERL